MFDAFAQVSTLPRSGAGLSLDRLARTFGDLWEGMAGSATRIVHVVGSNGKGSTAAFLEALIRRTGRRTGLYTSPHYFDFGERIQIGGEPVGEADLEAAWRYFSERARPPERFGGFEAMTVMAAYLFARADIDVLIVEAGIGGRYDPTRLFGGDLAILTSVDLEHTELLGRSLEEIAADKLDIVGPGGTVIAGWLPPELRDFCETYVKLSGRRLDDVSADYSVDCRDFAETLRIAAAGRAFGEGRRIEYRTPAGYFIRNSILALSAAERLTAPGGGEDLRSQFERLCGEFALPGRFENIRESPPLFCDVAHTPGAVVDVVESCKRLFPDAAPVFVLGMSVDKDFPEMCRLLGAYGDRFLTFPAAHKGQAPEILAAHLRAANPSARVECFASARAVADHVLAADFPVSTAVVATGGLFSSIEFRTAILGGDPSGLNFY
ncbi:MAG: bifunctional folylpolyglutamate synthase/dihydrofolate synthase [Allosphingosinicella sp.]